MTRRHAAAALLALFAVSSGVLAAKKKKKEEETQTLALPKDLPQTVTGETRRLAFHVSPLSAKGLLSQQVRDALKAINRASGGAPVLKLRAFVAGRGDVRRVRDIVSESFADRKQPLPVLTLVHCGGLPLEAAQVALEAVTQNRKEINPTGLAYISVAPAYADDPLAPAAPLAHKVLADLKDAVNAAGAEPRAVVRLTCYLSSLENLDAVRREFAAEYPAVAATFLQTQRAPQRAVAACEAIARLPAKPQSEVQSLTAAEGRAHIVKVNAGRVVLTGSQTSFGYQEKDARLAFDRLEKSLEQAGTSLKQAVSAHFYALSPGIAVQVDKVRHDYFRQDPPPATTTLLLESLPSMDSGFAVDVVAVKR